jgi:hypothetical protein
VDLACDLCGSRGGESFEVRGRDGIERPRIDIPIPTACACLGRILQGLVVDAGAFLAAIDAPHPQIPATGVLTLHVAFGDQPNPCNVGKSE